MVVVVQRLAVHREDDREGELRPARLDQSGHRAGHFALVHAGPRDLHREHVHVVRQVDGGFDLADLLGRLVGALRHDGLDERGGRVRVHHARPDPHEVSDRQHVVVAVLRQVVDAPPLPDRLVERRFEVLPRTCGRDARLRGALGDGRLRPAPDDVVDREVVAVNGVGAGVDVDDGGQLGVVQYFIEAKRQRIGIMHVANKSVALYHFGQAAGIGAYHGHFILKGIEHTASQSFFLAAHAKHIKNGKEILHIVSMPH